MVHASRAQRIDEIEFVEAKKIEVSRTQGASVLNRDRGQVRVVGEITRGAVASKQARQDQPVPLPRV